ncbi:MAG: MarR family transcriptional regulator [Candidatus Magasanikbacteria bacterium]|nr:MarR family transcriptional regulator [Candidatus Magasanikbacteria bacterium]
MNEFKLILEQFNLEPSAAQILMSLLETGEMQVKDITAKTKLSRTSVHDALNYLLVKEFVEYRKTGRNVFYQAVHPSKLYSLIEEKKNKTSLLYKEMEETIKTLTGTYNLSKGKPGVRFYEGPEGFEEIVLQNLQAKEIVYTYVNRDAAVLQNKKTMEKYFEAIKKSNVTEKLICADTPDAKELKKRLAGITQTQIKLLPPEKFPFEAGMDMYDGKIIYATYKKNQSIQVVIEDPELCKMQRQIFETLWSLLPE